MLRLSKKLLCALEAVLDIAYNAGSEPVQSRDITDRQGIPERYLEQVLQQMVRAGVLKGVRGPRGGYRLARERRRITVGDVARVIYANDVSDGEDAFTASPLGNQIIWPFWGEFREEVMKRLDAITIEDLCKRARETGLEVDSGPRADFAI